MIAWLTTHLDAIRRRRAVRRVAAAILEEIDHTGSLLLDKRGLASLGVSRKMAFKAVYHLIQSEQAHMRASRNGLVTVLSNREFSRFMRQRAAIAMGPPPPTRNAAPGGSIPGDEQVFSPVSMETAGECNWFSLDVEAEESNPEVSPLRQIVPDRPRDPWQGEGAAMTDNEKISDIFSF